MIRPVIRKDIDSIVSIHLDAFKGFFLTSLGREFLKFYYSVFLRSDETVTLCAEDEKGTIVGFSAATKVSKGFNSRLIKDNFSRFIIVSLKMLFTNPKALIRLMMNLTKKSETVEDDEDYAELFSIGVDSSQQGKGIGRLLLTQTEDALRREGVDKVSLTTDFDNNESALGFYHSMGYTTLYVFTTYPNRKMYRLIKNLEHEKTI